MPPTTYRTTTIALAKVKAKHIANQAGLNRLQELLVKAASNPNNGQNYAITIKRALKSLQECKEPILTQKDAVKLKFIGPAMAKKICPQSTGVNTVNNTTTTTDDDDNNNAKKKKAIPKSKKKINTNEVDADADKSMTTTTATASIMEGKQQQQPSTISRSGGIPMVCPRPAASSSSSMARSASLSSSMSFGEIGPTAKQSAYAIAKAEAEKLVLPSRGPWKVILLVDGREHKSKQVVSSCKQVGIPCEERHLAIGDMAWIARCVFPKDKNRQQQQQSTATTSKKKRKKGDDDDKYRTIEILVGTIIERKDVADLASSLYGTRYAEQRLRLSQCGLPQVLFLVEGDLNSCSNCPSETLQMAMMETRVNLGFQIVQTKHLTDTVNVLKTLHSRIVQRTFPEAFGKTSKNSIALPTFGGGNRRDLGRGNRRASSLLEMSFDTPPVPPFGTKRFITYPELKAKVEIDRERGTRSIRAITLAMLKQIPTLSQKKCTAMSNAYPTMNSLLEALSYYHDGDPKKLVRNIEIENGRTIGPSSASEVYTACCTLEDGSTVASHGVGVPLLANPPSMMMMVKKKPPPSTNVPPPLSVINNDNLSNNKSINNNRNKNNRTKTTAAVAVANNTKKPPPGMAASSVQKSVTNNNHDVESPPKKMRTESMNIAVTITTKNNSNGIVNKNDIKSSSLQVKSTRKRPAADSCCDYDSDVIVVSSPSHKQQLNNRETTKTATTKMEMVVDLLTPESSPIAMSRSSNLTEGTYSNDKTTATTTVAMKSKPLGTVKRRTPVSARGEDSFLFSSSDDDTPHRPSKPSITTTINNNNNKPAVIKKTTYENDDDDDTTDNMKSASSSKRRKTPAKTSSRRSSLSSSDGGSSFQFSSPEESPFPPARSIDNGNDNDNDNFDTEERKMSPAKNLSFRNLKSSNNNSVDSNKDVGVTGVVSLLDDDDDDDDDKKIGTGDQKQRYENDMQKAIRESLNNDSPSTTASASPPSADKIVARKVSNESLSPSSSQSSSSANSATDIKRHGEINDCIGSTRTPPGVTTKRGGGGATFSASSSTFTTTFSSSSDGDDNKNNDPAAAAAAAAVDTNNDTDTDTDGSPQFHKSLRERLCNKIPGKKKIIQEVIELDSDSD
jgi:ERCC4-type nuclease